MAASFKTFINLYYITLCVLYTFNLQYFVEYTGAKESFLFNFGLGLFAVLNIITVFVHRSLILNLSIFLCAHFYSFFALEYGSYDFVSFILLICIIYGGPGESDRKYFKWLVYISISSLYLSLFVQRLDDPIWHTGQAALVVASKANFRGVVDLIDLDFGSYIASFLTYTLLITECFIGLFILSKYRKYCFIVGIILHSCMMLTLDILNWQLVMVSIYLLLLKNDHSKSLGIRNLISPISSLLRK